MLWLRGSMGERTIHGHIVAVAFLATMLNVGVSWANPTGSQVVHGQVDFARPGSRTLNITNSPNAIINWRGFSISSNEVTRFIQQSSHSAILNRVTGANPSHILGQLRSNGHVFLINPYGIVFGQNSVIDTAGFVASTLNITNRDFLEGNYRFESGPGGAGDIINRGFIKAGNGGSVYLIAPNIENSGIIQTEGGNLILAAGEKITLVSLDSKDLEFEVQAPENEVVNLGELLTDGGALGIFAGTLRHSGVARADAVTMDAAGNIQFVAKGDIHLEEGSITSANGANGGNIHIQSETGTTLVAGDVQAIGGTEKGGKVRLLGERVALVDKTKVDASGAIGGGEVLVGGDYQGKNPDIQNATATYIGSEAEIKADAIHGGDGGKVIVWADDSTIYHGEISARSGTEGGDGGFVEVSGKLHLTYTGMADLRALDGEWGTLLLDPGKVLINSSTDAQPDTFNNVILGSQLALGNVNILTSAATGANGVTEDIDVDAPVTWSAATILTLDAGNNININSAVTNANGTLSVVAGNATNINAGGNVATGQFDLASVADATLSGGATITGATVTSSGGGQLLLGASQNGTLDGVTLDIDLDNTGYLHLVNGLTLANSHILTVGGATAHGYLVYDNTQTIGGTGQLVFANGSGGYNGRVYRDTAGDTLTLGPNVEIRGANTGIAYMGYYASDQIINQGTVTADVAGKSFRIRGDFSNAGTGQINVSDGTVTLGDGAGSVWNNAGAMGESGGVLNLAGNFATADIGAISQSGGTVNLTGTLDNNAATFDLAGTGLISLNLNGGTITGGTVTGVGGVLTNTGTSTLDGVTLDVDLTNTDTLHLVNGLTLANGHVLT
ncbi:MAG: filamentous hemagglutinin N-terminal domain-containing protein, partial [Gammaproteobacteria bacterium]|nr:filamentous hemagglutinin N-terminal domain-containing protein [Gammaproteobacteria bacterium]